MLLCVRQKTLQRLGQVHYRKSRVNAGRSILKGLRMNRRSARNRHRRIDTAVTTVFEIGGDLFDPKQTYPTQPLTEQILGAAFELLDREYYYPKTDIISREEYLASKILQEDLHLRDYLLGRRSGKSNAAWEAFKERISK